MHFNLGSADISEVSLSVIFEIIGNGHPDGTFATLQVVLEDNAGDRTTFTHTGTVPCTKIVWIQPYLLYVKFQ